ncbi:MULTISPECIES: hypothetical protein [Stenotrophomonas maltophilia group]|uniref:hypothetical protein n=1 Tax=Stenotrophomonas maltophilia group TaxID=995085 RepID=UPI00107191AC|nr:MULTISPECIES: hypothetical protein [Stenotrophomonas maltophilia group]MCF3497901.1 hypothetical protein [Stenotrophomonas maltophilia]MDQ4681518.1 hypothetical protein [Stenotrophomonas maltophilia group sp. RNC7]UGB21172.1 hypothetical protein LQ335_18310 [Stenotrophomonas maltophilia]
MKLVDWKVGLCAAVMAALVAGCSGSQPGSVEGVKPASALTPEEVKAELVALTCENTSEKTSQPSFTEEAWNPLREANRGRRAYPAAAEGLQA